MRCHRHGRETCRDCIDFPGLTVHRPTARIVPPPATRADVADYVHGTLAAGCDLPSREDIRGASAALDEQLARTDEAQRRVDEVLGQSRRAAVDDPGAELPSEDIRAAMAHELRRMGLMGYPGDTDQQ